MSGHSGVLIDAPLQRLSIQLTFLYVFCSGQITSSHFIDPTSEKEFICSSEDSSGMHKCSRLPFFVEDSRECTGDISTGLHNDSDCINWNQYYTECKPGDMNPFHGAISFDNIGLAWVAIFLVSQHT